MDHLKIFTFTATKVKYGSLTDIYFYCQKVKCRSFTDIYFYSYKVKCGSFTDSYSYCHKVKCGSFIYCYCHRSEVWTIYRYLLLLPLKRNVAHLHIVTFTVTKEKCGSFTDIYRNTQFKKQYLHNSFTIVLITFHSCSAHIRGTLPSIPQQ